MNKLDAKFHTTIPCLNGVHTYSIIEYDFGIIKEIDKLLIIIELMVNKKEFLSNDNLNLYFNIISNIIFSSKYKKALLKANNSNFFKNLSYFLEKIPDKFFCKSLEDNFNSIFILLFTDAQNEFFELKKQFLNYILFNYKIFIKFNEEEQIKIINTVCSVARDLDVDIDIDIINIIEILFNYDKENNFKFCCKVHSNYFNDNYEIMEPELYKRIECIEKLIIIIFDKEYRVSKKKLNNNNHNKIDINNNLNSINENAIKENSIYFFFYLLTFDISPCLQKSIISLLKRIILKYINIFFDKRKDLFIIILFVFIKSIFDVKIDALDLLFIIDQFNEKKIFENNESFYLFFKNKFLPIFLIEETNNLPIFHSKEEEKGKIDKSKYNNINISNEKKGKYGIKTDVEIDGVKYYLFSPSKFQKIISQKYNKNKYTYFLE